MRTFLFIGTALLLILLVVPIAQAFVPLAPIPNLDTSESANLSSYLNSIFRFAIVIGAFAAVVQLTMSGIKYMTSDGSTKTGDARKSIQQTLTGLILLLLSWLFLYVINPNLLNLDIFKNVEAPQTQAEREAALREDAINAVQSITPGAATRGRTD